MNLPLNPFKLRQLVKHYATLYSQQCLHIIELKRKRSALENEIQVLNDKIKLLDSVADHLAGQQKTRKEKRAERHQHLENKKK